LDRLDTQYRALESPDGRSLLNIESSGANIIIASLKTDSKFKNVQEAFKSLEYETTPTAAKIETLTSEVENLKKTIAEYDNKFDEYSKILEKIEAEVGK